MQVERALPRKRQSEWRTGEEHMGTYPEVRDTGEKSPTIPHRLSFARGRAKFSARETLWDGPVAD
jgi:hypothetical protein